MRYETYLGETTEYIASCKVTSKTYALYVETLHYEDGDIKEYILKSPTDPKKCWYGIPKGIETYRANSGKYTFQTLRGTPIKRNGDPVVFFIAGDIIDPINAK